MGLNGNIYIIEHRGCWINLRISQIPPDAAEKKRGYTVMQRKRRCVKALNVFLIVCLLAGCRSTAGAGSREPGRPKEEDISSTGRPGGDNGQNSADKEDGAGGSGMSSGKEDGEQPDIKQPPEDEDEKQPDGGSALPLLEGWREKAIVSDLHIENNAERCCGIFLNRDGRLECFTVSSRRPPKAAGNPAADAKSAVSIQPEPAQNLPADARPAAAAQPEPEPTLPADAKPAAAVQPEPGSTLPADAKSASASQTQPAGDISGNTEPGPLLWKYTLEDDSGIEARWSREAVSWTEALRGSAREESIKMFLGEDGCYYVCYADEDSLYHLVKQSGSSPAEIVIPDWDRTKEHGGRAVPGQIAVLENGNIAMAQMDGQCFLYSGEDGRILERFACGWYETMYAEGNDLFILDDDSPYILHYDGEKLAFLPVLAGNFRMSVRLAGWDGRLYACCSEGIFSAEKDGTGFHKVMEPGEFRFSADKGNLIKFFAAEDAFYTVCSDEDGLIMKYSPGGSGEQRVLTVYSLADNELLLDMIGVFQLRYPEIRVVFETAESSAEGETMYDRILALNRRLAAEEGPDVLVLDGLPAEIYAENGLLEDLNAALPELREVVEPNIFSCYTRGNAVYMLPARVMLPMLCTSGGEAGSFPDLASLAAHCVKSGSNTAVRSGLPYSVLLRLLWYNFMPELSGKDASALAETMEDFLKQAESLCRSQQAAMPPAENTERGEYVWNSYFSGVPADRPDYASGEQDLMFINMSGIYELSTCPQEAEMRGGQLLAGSRFFPNGLLGVCAQSAQKELALLFVRTAFSYRAQKAYTCFSGFPIHKRVLREYEQLDFSRITSKVTENIWARYFNRQEAEQMIGIVRDAQNPIMWDQAVFEIFAGGACAYLQGDADLGDAAKKISDEIARYYSEVEVGIGGKS